MEKSIIYNLLDNNFLHKWREEIEEAESETWFFTNEQDALKALEAELNENGKKLLAAYSLAVENRIDYVNHNLKIKVLNFGIKLGMDLQKAFSDFEQ